MVKVALAHGSRAAGAVRGRRRVARRTPHIDEEWAACDRLPTDDDGERVTVGDCGDVDDLVAAVVQVPDA